jgi:23S rRNA (guanosine2251-2'-O)-methyltransferase
MAKGHRPSKPHGKSHSGRPRFWGRHAVYAALDNPNRRSHKLWITRDEANKIIIPDGLTVIYADVADLGRMVPNDAPHQGMVLEVDPLEDIWLADLIAMGEEEPHRPIILLDQVTDPHNVGAILRSAAAFNALGLVTQDRHAPPESGTVARTASGALEHVPWVRVVNLSRALGDLADAGYWRIGLTGEAEITLEQALGPEKIALVLGAEGDGMRQNTESHCDQLASLPITRTVESLNVSNAAAIALYAASCQGKKI